MDLDDDRRDRIVLLLALAPPDAGAVARTLDEAGIATRPCGLEDLSREFRAGVGAIVLAEETLTGTVVRELSALIEEQPIWSDVPLVVLTTPKRDAGAPWRLIAAAPSIRNATFLERPMRIATLVQAVKVALRGRAQQYRLRDQMLERDRLLGQSEMNERRLSAVLNNTKVAVFLLDEARRCTFMNAAAETLTGYSLAETQGRALHDALHRSRPDDDPRRPRDHPVEWAFPETAQIEGEEVFVRKDGQTYPVAFAASPIRQSDVVVGTVIEVHDMTRQKADVERLRMLMNELNHRVKNTLATVQSIFLQTMRSEAVSDAARDRIMSRVMALSRSHDLLTERSWVSASLHEVVRRALAPFGAAEDGSGRFSLAGDAFELRPKPALAIAMGLHELATNAVKYGALSVEGGRVELSWKRIPGGILQLRWVERGGPPVAAPGRSGFGRRLIERGLAHELGGEARIGFHPDGVICEIDAPTAKTLAASRNGMSNDGSDFAAGPRHSSG